ncbi:MAG TPA: hypothetical protein ENJ31_09055 [Anaerolineae bacterium]|nr:hypothetical protein [Anaerolineae bacterium]
MNSTDIRCKDACPALPESLVRLRYFFGKRLGVADLRDEQSYHRSKQRLHNHHAHGSGVMCGLGLSRFDSGTDGSAVIRVAAGAALDSCGREVIVGHAQCIDLAAWFARRREQAEAAGETFPPAGSVDEENLIAICVAVRYRECETTPESAPRDPCACDTGGCEFGRVEEGFELAVLLADEAQPYRTRLRFPPLEELAEIIGQASDAGDLLERLAEAQTATCPQAREPDWVLLGCLGLKLAVDHSEVQALVAEQAWSPPTETLLSTAAIQELLALLLVGVMKTGDSKTIDAELYVAGEAGDTVLRVIPQAPIVEDSVSKSPFQVRRLVPGQGWVRSQHMQTRFVGEADPPFLELGFDTGFLEPGGRYRLTTTAGSHPIVDEELRPLCIERSFEIPETEDGEPQPVILFPPN